MKARNGKLWKEENCPIRKESEYVVKRKLKISGDIRTG